MSHSIFLGLNFGAFYFLGLEFRVILFFWIVEICSRTSIPVKKNACVPPPGLIAYYTDVMMYKVQKDLMPDETIELVQSDRFTHTYNTRPLILKISSYTHKALGRSQFHMQVT